MSKTNYRDIINKMSSICLIVIMTFSLVACSDDETASEDKSFTYNTYMEASPACWNPHAWVNSADSVITDYTEMGLVDVQMTEDGSWEWTFEMADSITDITADYTDKEKWAIGAEETGRVWEIKLNESACWEDGTAINADTYVNSLKLLLDPEMKNLRANKYYDYTQSASAIAGALNYYNNSKAGQPIYKTLAEMGYATVDEAINAGVAADSIFIDIETAFGYDCETENGYVGYQDTATEIIDTDGYAGEAGAKVNGKILFDNCFATGKLYVAESKDFIMIPSGETYSETSFDKVGLIKVDDYTLYYITAAPISEFYFYTAMSSNWIVHEETYNAGKAEANGVVGTTYGTSVDTYMSYGPYKLVSFEKDKQFVMEKNTKWYGYNDGKHEGQFQTTKVVVDIISEHSTALQLFLSGELDKVTLEVDDMEKYRMSEYLYSYDETYTLRWVFATDLDALIALEEEAGDGANKRVLAYDDFRKAISLAMDRDSFCSLSTPGNTSAYYLINNAYYTDIENDNDSVYRDSIEAKSAILDLYGIAYENDETSINTAYENVTGYDVEAAKALFTSVYNQAVADGNYKDGQDIRINCMVSASSSLSAQDTAQQNVLNDMIAAATAGTPFEGKITVTFQCGASNRYQDCADGKIEMIRGAWGGAAFYPHKAIGCYTNPDYAGTVHESCGWDPTTEQLDITYDFDGDGTAETLSKTYKQWTVDLNDNNVYGKSDVAIRTFILASIEKGVLQTYQCIPWSTETVNALYSQKVKNACEDYSAMYEFGGIRHLTYNYDDEQWEKFVKESDGILHYE